VTGGQTPYTYQWQVYDESGGSSGYAEYVYSYVDHSDPYDYYYNTWDEIGWARAVVPGAQNVQVTKVTLKANQLCADSWPSEVSLWLKSPAGPEVLVWQASTSGCQTNVTFTTNAFNGQWSEGQWLVYFKDSYGDGGGTAFGVKLYIEYFYQIQGGWTDIQGAILPTYQPPALTDTTMYRLHTTDFCGDIYTDPVTISVTPLPTAYAGEDYEICETESYMLEGEATNYGSVLWTTSGDGEFDDPTLLNATYTPGPNDKINFHADLTLTAYALNECPDTDSDVMTLFFAPLPLVDAGDDGYSCEDTYFQTFGWTNWAYTTYWTTSGDGYFDDPTSSIAKYYPGDDDLDEGSVVLTYNATSIPPCNLTISDDLVVTFVYQPTAYAGPNATICANDTYTLPGEASDYASILWTSSGDGEFDDETSLEATYTPGNGDINSGSVVLTLTAFAIEPCLEDAIDEMTLAIVGLPTGSAGPNGAICEGSDFVLSGATATNYSSVEWTTSGTGSFENPNVVTATYIPSPGDIADGSVTLTLTVYAKQPCEGYVEDEMTLNIGKIASADAGDDAAICANETYQLDGTAANFASVKWTTSGDGTFDNANIQDPVYTPGNLDVLAGTATLTITAYAQAPCTENGVDAMVLSISKVATANAGDDDKICENETYTLNGTAANYYYTVWYTSGDGTFDNNTLLDATYYPGPTDILLGYADLTLTAYPIEPCPDPASDMMTLSIDRLPDVPGVPAGADFVCVLTTDTTWYTTVGSPNALSYMWDIFPAEAGTIEGEGTEGIVTWSKEYFGPVFIRVKGVNDCGEGEFSEPFEVTADPCVGIPDGENGLLTVKVFPNPSDGRFNLRIDNISDKLEMSIMDMTGQILMHETVSSDNETFMKEFDITTYPKGVYFLRLYGDNVSKVERLIVR
jgi:hypothetical protein